MKNKMITGLIVRPGASAETITFDGSTRSLMDLVGGHFEILRVWPRKRIVLIINDCGTYNGEPNRYIEERGVMIFGTFLICRYDTTINHNLCSLTEPQIAKFTKRFTCFD